MKNHYYIKRQTREGKNQGKWWVYDPSGVSICPCESRAIAVHVCAAFQLASAHPTEGNLIGNEGAFVASSEDWKGKRYPLHKNGCAYVGTKK